MKNKIATIFAFIICLLLSPAVLYAQQAPLSDNPLKTRLDSAVHQAAIAYLRDSTANGIVIAINDRGNNHYYRYGENIKGSGRLPSFKLSYNIRSVAKTFVSTLLAQAVLEKKASLQDDIRKFLPGSYPNLQWNGAPIRLVNLANHTSGLPSSFHQYSPAVTNALRGKTLAEQADFFGAYSADSLLLDLHHVKPDTLPGSIFRYNSSAYMLLVNILERIYGRTYPELIAGYLKQHLHMYDSSPLLEKKDVHNAAQGYNRNNDPVAFINLRGYYIGPSTNSTISDMMLYIKAQLSQKDPAVRLTHLLTYGRSDGFGLGLGWMINTENGQRYFYHDGNTKLGFNTLLTIYPQEQLGMIIIVNDIQNQDKVGRIENAIRQSMKY